MSKRIILKTGIILFGTGLIYLFYLPVINGYFLAEDYAWWPYVKDRSFLSVLTYFFTSPSRALAGFYHPLVGLSYWFNVKFFGMNPLGFHLTNLLIHMGNFLLVVAIANFFFKRRWLAFLAGFLFIIFPFHSEAVAWIDGRHDLLMTFFYLLSFYTFLRWGKSGKTFILGLSVFSFLLALTAKEMAITLPLVLTAYLILRCQASQHRVLDSLRRTVWYWLVLGFYFILHAFYVGHLNPFSAASHLGIIIPRVLIFYLIFLAFAILFFLLFVKKKIFTKDNLTLVPFFGLLVGIFYLPAAFTPTQERYLYLPSTIASIYMVNLFFLFWTSRWVKKKFIKALMLFCLILLSAISIKYLVNRVYDWKRASEIAGQVVNDFRIYARDIPREATIYFLNLPDNYHGSYIFRTHVKEAMEYGVSKEFRKIVVLPQTLGVGDSSAQIMSKSNFTLKSKDGYLIFAPTISRVLSSGEARVETEDYQLLVENKKTLSLTLKNDYLGKEGVFFFKYNTVLSWVR